MAAEHLVCVDLCALRRSLLAALGLTALACGPGVPGGVPPNQPITATSGDEDDDVLTSGSSGSSITITDSVSSAEDSTTWHCQGGTDTLTETFCQPPPGETGGTLGSDGGTLDGGTLDSGTVGESGVATTGVDTDTDTDGGLCDAYVGMLPNTLPYYDQIIESIGPYEQEGACCWDITYTVSYPCGRPFFVDDLPRVASVREREDWAERDRPDVDAIDEHTRMLLTGVWLEDALAEHASIAAFARFALQLLALGATPELVADTHRAMADELEHARLCFALASAYGGRDIGPGALALDGALLDDVDLASVVVATIREGCIGETMAAMQAEVGRGLARDPVVAAALERIAADESRHAALAWRFVDWAVKQGGRPIRDVAAEAFLRYAPLPAGNMRGPSPDLTAHGRLSASDLALLQRRTYEEVIRPCAAAVLALPAERRDQLLM